MAEVRPPQRPLSCCFDRLLVAPETRKSEKRKCAVAKTGREINDIRFYSEDVNHLLEVTDLVAISPAKFG